MSAFELVRPYLRWLYLSLDPSRRPGYFSACWRVPPAKLDEFDFPAPNDGRCDFLLFPMTDWHTRVQRTHHLALGLAARGHRCFWFNPHLGCEYRLPYLLDPHPRVGALADGIHEVHVHLPREHAYHRRLLRSSESMAVASAATELAAAADIRCAVQMVGLPIWMETAIALRERFGFPIVYDCHDYLRGFRNVSGAIADAEPAALEAADLILFSADRLMRMTLERQPGLAGKCILVRNAAESQLFAAPAANALRNGTVVGYAGALDHWFDIECIQIAARDHPNWTFMFAGRVEDRRILALKALPNVRLFGELQYEEIPGFLACVDVGIIPFEISELTLSTNPIKLYEYFSLGLPVVGSRLPEVEVFDDLVYLAGSPEEFSRQLERAAAEDDVAKRRRRIEIARNESWDSRVRAILDGIDKLYPVAAPA